MPSDQQLEAWKFNILFAYILVMEQHGQDAVLFNFQWIVQPPEHNNGSIVVFVSALQKLNIHVAHKDDKFFAFVSVLIS